VAGVVVTVAGFFFVYYQIKQINRAGRASTHASIFSHSLELTRLMLDHPEVRPYLYDGKDIAEGDPAYNQVMLACEMLADFYEHVSLQRENLPKQSLDCWDKAMARRYLKNPVLEKYVEENGDVYARDLSEAIENGRRLLAGSVVTGT